MKKDFRELTELLVRYLPGKALVENVGVDRNYKITELKSIDLNCALRLPFESTAEDAL
jgi:hypothetical protein